MQKKPRQISLRRNEFDLNQTFFFEEGFVLKYLIFFKQGSKKIAYMSSFCLQYLSNIDDPKQHVIIIVFDLFPKWTPRKKSTSIKKVITTPVSWNQRSQNKQSKKKVGQKPLLAMSLTFVLAFLISSHFSLPIIFRKESEAFVNYKD